MIRSTPFADPESSSLPVRIAPSTIVSPQKSGRGGLGRERRGAGAAATDDNDLLPRTTTTTTTCRRGRRCRRHDPAPCVDPFEPQCASPRHHRNRAYLVSSQAGAGGRAGRAVGRGHRLTIVYMIYTPPPPDMDSDRDSRTPHRHCSVHRRTSQADVPGPEVNRGPGEPAIFIQANCFLSLRRVLCWQSLACYSEPAAKPQARIRRAQACRGHKSKSV